MSRRLISTLMSTCVIIVCATLEFSFLIIQSKRHKAVCDVKRQDNNVYYFILYYSYNTNFQKCFTIIDQSIFYHLLQGII